MRQTATTVFGIIWICIGAIGLLFDLLVVALTFYFKAPATSIQLSGLGISLVNKVLVIALGIGLLKRARFILPLLAAVIILSVTDSTIYFTMVRVPPPADPNPFYSMGRVVGELGGAAVPLLLYVGMAIYLLLPKTKLEFSTAAAAAPVTQ